MAVAAAVAAAILISAHGAQLRLTGQIPGFLAQRGFFAAHRSLAEVRGFPAEFARGILLHLINKPQRLFATDYINYESAPLFVFTLNCFESGFYQYTE